MKKGSGATLLGCLLLSTECLQLIIYFFYIAEIDLVRISRISAVYFRCPHVFIKFVTVPKHDKLQIATAFFILRTKRNVWLILAWVCVFFVYQFVIDMNVSGCRRMPAVVSFRLCVDCNKFNQL